MITRAVFSVEQVKHTGENTTDLGTRWAILIVQPNEDLALSGPPLDWFLFTSQEEAFAEAINVSRRMKNAVVIVRDESGQLQDVHVESDGEGFRDVWPDAQYDWLTELRDHGINAFEERDFVKAIKLLSIDGLITTGAAHGGSGDWQAAFF